MDVVILILCIVIFVKLIFLEDRIKIYENKQIELDARQRHQEKGIYEARFKMMEETVKKLTEIFDKLQGKSNDRANN